MPWVSQFHFPCLDSFLNKAHLKLSSEYNRTTKMTQMLIMYIIWVFLCYQKIKYLVNFYWNLVFKFSTKFQFSSIQNLKSFWFCLFCFAFCFMSSHKSLIWVIVRFLDTFFFGYLGQWTRRPQSGSLTPCSYAFFTHVLQTMTLHGCVTADITYSMSHVHHKILACSWAVLCSTPILASPWKPWLLLH